VYQYANFHSKRLKREKNEAVEKSYTFSWKSVHSASVQRHNIRKRMRKSIKKRKSKQKGNSEKWMREGQSQVKEAHAKRKRHSFGKARACRGEGE
jgi:hypothetical protein